MSRLSPRRRILGLVTIGQTPRPDLVTAFERAARGADVVVTGALDGLDATALADVAAPGPYPLLVRLASGGTAEVPRDRLVPLVETAAQRLAAAGAALVVVACAGDFPAVRCPVPVVVPGRVVPAIVRALAAGRRLGVVTPNAAQVPFAEAKWREDGFDVTVVHAAPGAEVESARAAADLRAADVALVVLDCMGHDEASRVEFALRSGLPTVAAQPLVAELAGALL